MPLGGIVEKLEIPFSTVYYAKPTDISEMKEKFRCEILAIVGTPNMDPFGDHVP